MINTQDAGNANSVGLRSTLPRLRPFEIGPLLIPGTHVAVMDATDQQFQTFIASTGIPIEATDITEWSFDDRIGIINYARKNGIDLFTVPNKNNSEPELKQFGNNSENELIGELFEGAQATPQATLDDIGNASAKELRDDIDKLISEMQKSSDNEQKEFGASE